MVDTRPVREWIRSLELRIPVVCMTHCDRKDAIQLRSLLGLLDLVHWSALPHDTIFPELPPTPAEKLCGEQKPEKAEGVTPVHEGCD